MTKKNRLEKTRRFFVARATGLEPAIYGVTGRRDNQLRYALVAEAKLLYLAFFVNTSDKNFLKQKQDPVHPTTM